MAHRHRGKLTSDLDKQVYTVVRRVLDDQPGSRVSIGHVYDVIRSSNSSLNRKPKKILEDSIERVLDTLRADDDEGDSEEILDAPGARDEPKSSNGLNKSLVGAWSTNTVSRSGTATPKRQANGEPTTKRRRTEKPVIDHSPPDRISLRDMGGIEKIARQMYKLLAVPMWDPQYSTRGHNITQGILLHGPPGCGKTMFANALAAELKVNYISIAAPSIVSGMSGESEKALRDHFEEAKKCAPCLMFIDEIDAIAPRRESAQREMEKRIVAQLSTCMDDLDPLKNDGKPVVVLAATSRPDSLDPALRRGGRFGKEIVMPVPNEAVREQILRAMTRDSNLSGDVDFATLARRTPGYVGADLKDLVALAEDTAEERYLLTVEAAAATASTQTASVPESSMEVDSDSASPDPAWLTTWHQVRTYMTTNPNFSTDLSSHQVITMADFLVALPQIQPSALREGFATIPTVSFGDIGALSSHISTLQNTLINPILSPALYSSFNLRSTAGILLWGPPGNGKTLLAKAVANASHANFISVKGPELLNKYVGESERSVRQLFSRARSSVPVIIFFDEIDALAPRRDGANSEASSRVVNTLLSEMDGVGAERDGIYIVAATNRPDMIDPAMKRPGRLETLLYVGLPDEDGRVDILKTLTGKIKNFSWTQKMEALAKQCVRFSGADLESLVTQAKYQAITRMSSQGQLVGAHQGGQVLVEDFVECFNRVKPSVSEEEHERFTLLREELEQ